MIMMDWAWKSLKVDVKCSLLDLPGAIQALHPFTSQVEFFVSDSVINNVRLSRFNFCYFFDTLWRCTFSYCSVDWFNQLGIVTFTRPIFGRPLSAEKCAIDCSYRWTGDGFITPFCLFCQTIRPNIPQVNKKSNAPQVTVIIIYTITENARLGSDC